MKPLLYTEFQFQYGTIKRVPFGMVVNDTPIFQFQYGTIKRLPHASRIEPSTFISIPIWYN